MNIHWLGPSHTPCQTGPGGRAGGAGPGRLGALGLRTCVRLDTSGHQGSGAPLPRHPAPVLRPRHSLSPSPGCLTPAAVGPSPGWAPGSGLLPVAGKSSTHRPHPSCASGKTAAGLRRLWTEAAFSPPGSLGKGPHWLTWALQPPTPASPETPAYTDPALSLRLRVATAAGWRIPLHL